jgi:hypothetical protein
MAMAAGKLAPTLARQNVVCTLLGTLALAARVAAITVFTTFFHAAPPKIPRT